MTEIKPFLCENLDADILREEWTKWLRSFELYLISEEIGNVVKKKNKLLHLGGQQLQTVIFNLPDALVDYVAAQKTDVYGILIEKLNEHFSPTRNSTFERHQFRAIRANDGEDFKKFLVRVRQHANRCSFGITEQEAQENNIKDKLIDCWASAELKRKLLEKEYTLAEIINMCHVHQQISAQSQAMSRASSEADPSASIVNKINQRPRLNNDQSNYRTKVDGGCSRCGSENHGGDSPRCPALKQKCNKCGLVGHFARKCKTKPRKRRFEDAGEKSYPARRRKFVNHVDSVDDLNGEGDNEIRQFDCFQIQCHADIDKAAIDADELVKCNVGNVPITMLIDSGSKCNIINSTDWKTLKDKDAIVWNVSRESSTRLTAYSGGSLDIYQVNKFSIGRNLNNLTQTEFRCLKQ